MEGIPPVRILFAVGGVADVDKAFSTIEQRASRMEQASTRANSDGTRSRIRNADTEAKERERALGKVAKDAAKAEAEQTRNAEREQARRDGIVRRSSEMAGREAKKAADLEIRERERVAKEVERQEERMMRIRIRSSEMAGRAAAAEARAELAAKERVSRGIGSSFGDTGRNIGGMISGIGSMAAGALGIGGGFALANIASQAMSGQHTASLIRNVVTVGNNNQAPEGSSVDNLVKTATAASRETNVDKDEILQAALKYAQGAKGGDIKGVLGNMSFFAKMSKVTGTSMDDIASAAGTLQSQNQDLGPKEMQQMLLDLFAQTGKGSLSMPDLAKQVGTLGSTRSVFQGNVADNQRKLIALAQIAAPEGSKDEAGTYVKDLAQALAKPKDVALLKSWGVKMDKYGAVASPENLIESVFRGSHGDMNKILEVFGAKGAPIFRGLSGAFKAAGGGEAGIEAVKKEMGEVTKATMRPEDLDKQIADQLEEPGERFRKVLNELSLDIEEKMLPWMPQLAEAAEKLLPALAGIAEKGMDLAAWFANNPIKGIGDIIALSITKDLAEAGLGKVFEKILNTQIGAKMASGLQIAGAAIAITEVGMMVIDAMGASGVADQKKSVATTNEASNVASKVLAHVRDDKVTPEDVKNAQESLKSMEKKAKEERENVDGWHLSSDSKKRDKAELDNTTLAITALRKALELAVPAVAKLGAEANNTHPDNPGSHGPIDKRPP